MSYMRRTKLKPLILLLAFSAVIIFSYVFDSQQNSGKSIDGIVEKVKDGDTIAVSSLSGDKQFTCSLYGIDTPELKKNSKQGQPYSIEAKDELEKLVYKKEVQVILTGEKGYKREICFVTNEGKSINLEMVKRGYAWAYREYLERPYASEYIDAERKARAMGIGLWQQKNPQPPWEFRQTNSLR